VINPGHVHSIRAITIGSDDPTAVARQNSGSASPSHMVSTMAFVDSFRSSTWRCRPLRLSQGTGGGDAVLGQRPTQLCVLRMFIAARPATGCSHVGFS